jgi:hypothetical protein
MDEDPVLCEDITTVDSRRSNLHETIDSLFPPPGQPTTGRPSCVPEFPRWYTVSPPSSDSGVGVPRHDAPPLIGSFSEAKKGCQVLTSQQHIGEQSRDTAKTYAMMYGIVLAEYIDGGTNTPMFIVNYGRPWLRYRIAQSLCDLRPLEAQGSTKMWHGRVNEPMLYRMPMELDFNEADRVEKNVADGGSDATGQGTMLLGANTLVRNECGRPLHQFPLLLPARGEWPLDERRIQGYNKDSPATGTDDSTAHKSFPKVTISFPSYLLFYSNVNEAPDSSGDEWIGGKEDWATYDEWIEEDEDPKIVVSLRGEDRDWSIPTEPVEPLGTGIGEADDYTAHRIRHGYVDEDYKEWSQSSDSFKAMPLEDVEFERYYHQSNRTLEHITLLGDGNNFTGPQPGYVQPTSGPIPYSPVCFFDLF